MALSEPKPKTNSGTVLWERAKKIIPGGNCILSKRSERYLPGEWPAYYAKAKGCEVWDLDGNHYFDFAQMGVGACSLGYADPDVDAAVKAAIDAGSMCTLNTPDEVLLAEKLIELHPWAEMARFSRTGGEACAIAVRIARAASGKPIVAFCGYHGWHDWYLAANLADKNSLDGQLLPGLEPNGVPRSLSGSALGFHYNSLQELEQIIADHPGQVGVIMMEPLRGSHPEPGFLEGVRAIADRIGAVLIFDEVTSAFRVNLGGIHKTLGVEPDLAIFGKALGNGYPISAVIGRRSVMDHAQDSFISSTLWSERTGFAAALASIAKMEREPVQEQLVHYGERVNAGWRQLASSHGIQIGISGVPPLTSLSFKVQSPLEVQTLYAQEMLGRGFLLGAAVYTTYAYSDAIVDQFIENSDAVWALLKRAIDSGDVSAFVRGGIASPGFSRLT